MGDQPERYSVITWRKSRHSADAGNCVEIASLATFVLVRDSHNQSGPVLAVTPRQWRGLVRRIQDGDLDFG
jgi:hypothetical protein